MDFNVELAKVMLQIGGTCLIAHFALSFTLHWMLRNDPIHDSLFAYPPFGQFVTKKPWQIHAKYIWPWAAVPSELSSQSALVRFFFGLTRLAGFVAIAGFLLFIGLMFFG